MKNKFVVLLLATCIVLSATACGGSTDAPNTQQTESETETSTEGLLGGFDVDENLFSVEITIPAGYVGETTQEEFDAICKENGYKSITLNADGSATYVMTKTQHKKMLEELSASIDTSLSEMVASEEYPNFTDISTNKNYTEFTITTKSTEIDLAETFTVMAFYMYGGMYNVFSGENVDNIHIDFINADSGEIIHSADLNDSENNNAEENSETIAIELKAGEQGEYGKMITMSAGTDMEESFYVYYVPAGTYGVKNLGNYMTQVNVYEGFAKNEETGYDEYTNMGDIKLVDSGKTETITVPDGWFIEISEPAHISLTLVEGE